VVLVCVLLLAMVLWCRYETILDDDDDNDDDNDGDGHGRCLQFFSSPLVSMDAVVRLVRGGRSGLVIDGIQLGSLRGKHVQFKLRRQYLRCCRQFSHVQSDLRLYKEG
jgi:hypothetical protein